MTLAEYVALFCGTFALMTLIVHVLTYDYQIKRGALWPDGQADQEPPRVRSTRNPAGERPENRVSAERGSDPSATSSASYAVLAFPWPIHPRRIK